MTAVPAPTSTQVLIQKPTIIDGEWRDVPTVVRMEHGRIVEVFPGLSAREQVKAAAQCLALMVIVFPPIFMAADWLRYTA